MINIAKNISLQVGVYIRVDMFVAGDGTVRVQEFSTNHLNGQRHCSAKVSGDCVDSCFLGQMWNDTSANVTLGGSKATILAELGAFLESGDEVEKCGQAVAFEATAAPFRSTCPDTKSSIINMTNGMFDNGCAVCGDNHMVTCPDQIFSHPKMPDYPCGMLQDAGIQGLIPEEVCLQLPDLVQDVCGCMLMPEASQATCPAPPLANNTDVFDGACSICGEGKRVGCDNAMFMDPRMPDYSCGMLEAAGWKGMLELEVCQMLPPLVQDACMCHAIGSAQPSCA